MTEKELEQLFRKKFDERTFEFNPAAWQGAEKLIVEGEKRKRRRAVVAWSAAASVLVMGGIMTYNMLTLPDLGTTGPQIAWPSTHEAAAPSASDMAVETDPTTARFEDNTVTEPVADEATPTTTLNRSTSNTEVATASTTAQSSQTADVNTGSDISNVIAAVDQTSAIEANPAAAQGVQNTTPEFVEGIQVNNRVTNTIDARPTASNIESADVSSVSTREVQNTNNSPEVVASDVALETPVGDTEDDEAAPPIVERPKHVVQPWTFGVEGGVNMTELSGSTRGMVPALYGGLFAGYRFSDSWGIQSGATYARRSSTGETQNMSTKDYGFGLTTVDVEVTSSTVDYLEIPVLMSYQAGRHQVTAGGYAAFKVSNSSHVDRTVTGTISGTENESYYAQGYEDNTTPVDFGLSLGYAFRLTDRWLISASGNMGLADAYTMDDAFNQHLQIRLGAKYTLWR